jgi:ribosomal protein L12E/L44/L45/RPP1/RPP2
MGRIVAVGLSVIFAVLIVVSALHYSTDRQRMIAAVQTNNYEVEPALANCVAKELDQSDLSEELKNAFAQDTTSDITELSPADEAALQEVNKAIQTTCPLS